MLIHVDLDPLLVDRNVGCGPPVVSLHFKTFLRDIDLTGSTLSLGFHFDSVRGHLNVSRVGAVLALHSYASGVLRTT